VLGKEHPDPLVSMNNLAIVLRTGATWGKYEQAEEMHRQELETMLGKEHPDTLRIAPQMHQTVVLRIGRVSVATRRFIQTQLYRGS